MFSDAPLSDNNVVLCYVLSQYQKSLGLFQYVASADNGKQRRLSKPASLCHLENAAGGENKRCQGEEEQDLEHRNIYRLKDGGQ
jgi:hypothetical protein